MLHIALQEGFAGEAVILRIGGKEVFREAAVKTRMQTGLAASFEMNVEGAAATLEVVLPGRNLSESIAVPLVQDAYVGVSLGRDGKITHRLSREPFGYV